MRGQLFFALTLVFTAAAIKVPVDGKDNTESEPVTSEDQSQAVPTYFPPDTSNIDSYLVPPDPHKPEEVLPDVIATPATFLLPPTAEKQIDYYYNTPSVPIQSDWYPIAQVAPTNIKEALLPQRQPDFIPIFMNDQSQLEFKQHRGGKLFPIELETIEVPTPSRQLEPPSENAPNDYIVSEPSEELELPIEEVNPQFNVSPDFQTSNLKNQDYNPLLTQNLPDIIRHNPAVPTISLHLTPPKPLLTKYKNPTKLYPKKYSGGFKPIPIPIAQFEESTLDVPKAKPVKSFKPLSKDEIEYLTPDEKKVYLYEQAEQKRKLKGQGDGITQEQLAQEEQQLVEPVPTEQEASETNFRHPGRNVYPAPLRQAPPPAPARDTRVPPPGDRTEFRMHGMKGPHSYQFGYDTGKGKNRQFRYEERDNDGHVKGHYGYMDKHGKLRVVNYDAHPEHGFRADPAVENDS